MTAFGNYYTLLLAGAKTHVSCLAMGKIKKYGIFYGIRWGFLAENFPFANENNKGNQKRQALSKAEMEKKQKEKEKIL